MATMDWWAQVTMVVIVIASSSQASVLEYSVKDIFVELASWGTVSVGRYNVNSTDPFNRHIKGSLTTISIKEINLLDSAHKTIHSYNLRDNKKRLFSITRWEGSEYWSLGASGRSMEAENLEGLSGSVTCFAHIFTENGIARHGPAEYLVKTGDSKMDIELKGLTGCSTCHNVAFVEVIVSIKGNNGIPENVHMYGEESTRIEVPGSTILYVNEQVGLYAFIIAYSPE